MTRWRTLPAERKRLFAAVGLQLLDALTEAPPLGRIRLALQIQAGGAWLPAVAPILTTPGGIVSVPGLGRTARPADAPVRRYRIRIEADLYLPLYRASVDGISFDVHPYSDDFPPATSAKTPAPVMLVPASRYPFPTHLRVARGLVVDANGARVADAVVREGTHDVAITSERGEFALPLRIAPDGVPVVVDASHPRTGRNGSIQVTLPGDFGKSLTIQVK